METSKIVYGENLEYLKSMPDEYVDLFLFDPTFNSQKEYLKVGQYESEKEVMYFEDMWRGGIHTYIEELKKRVIEMYRILKPNGSIVIHCDPTANSYIRTYVLDKIFGMTSFRNEIPWCYIRPGRVSLQFLALHDTLYWYSKGDKWTFNIDKVRMPYKENTLKTNVGKKFNKSWKDGMEYKPHPKGKLPPSWWNDIVPDWWDDIGQAYRSKKEYVHYPTQKAEKLYERLVIALTNPGDLVADPYMGSGTTPVVCYKTGRRFIGIDFSPICLDLTKFRLDRLNPNMDSNISGYEIILDWYDERVINKMDPIKFQKLCIEKIGGVNTKPGTSHDGKKESESAIIEVKQQRKVGLPNIDQYKSVMEREKAKKLIIIALSFASTAEAEAARLRNKGTNIELVNAYNLLNILKPPTITLSQNNDKINTQVTSYNGEVVNYMWFVNNIPHTLIDKDGVFDISEIKKGSQIKCKITDSAVLNEEAFITVQ